MRNAALARRPIASAYHKADTLKLKNDLFAVRGIDDLHDLRNFFERQRHTLLSRGKAPIQPVEA